MSTPVILSLTFAAFVLLGLALLSYQVHRRSSIISDESDAPDQAAIDRDSLSDYYRPMIRMLDARELAQARELTGIAAGDFARFRSARIRSFRTYLADMRLDFHRIEFKMRYLMLSASAHEADLVRALNRLKSDFQFKLLRVEVELLLFQFGVGTVDVSALVAMLEQFDSSLVSRPATHSAVA